MQGHVMISFPKKMVQQLLDQSTKEVNWKIICQVLKSQYYNIICTTKSLYKYVYAPSQFDVFWNIYFLEIKSARNPPDNKKFGNILFKLNIINGTIWLSHSGDVRSFSPVLGIPPATSSDMSLATAMQKLSEVTLNMSNVKWIH